MSFDDVCPNPTLYASISYQPQAQDMARDIADVADLFEDEDIDEKALYVALLW